MTLKELFTASIFFLFITIIFFYKIFLGLIPLPSDLIVGSYLPWRNHNWGYSAGVPVKNPKLSDAVSIFYPLKEMAAEMIKKGEIPLWNPLMFAGYPLLASPNSGLAFPTMIFYLFTENTVAWTLQTMSQPFLASFFMYLFLRHIKLSKLPSIFGSVAYGFGGFTISWMQWNAQATASMFLPILLFFENKYLISRQSKWGIALSLFICLLILAGYPPIIPFTSVALVLWYIFNSKNKLQDLRIIFFIILGFSLSGFFLLPVLELIQISQRKVEALGSGTPFLFFENLINLISPDFFGSDATGNFWGKGDHMDATLFSGTTTLILALLAVKKLFKKIEVQFAICLIVVTLLITISNPFSSLLYNLGTWGATSITMNRANFLLCFALSLLGAYGISLIKNYSEKLSLKLCIVFFSIVLGLITGLVIVKELLGNYSSITLEHINIGLRNLILPTLIVLTLTFIIFLIKKYKTFKLPGTIIVILILSFELFRYGWKFNTFSSPSFIFPDTPISGFLEKYPADRIIAEDDIFPANMWVPFKISSIGGYDSVYPLNIAKLLAVANSENPDADPQPRWGIIQNFKSNILDETNTRFLLTKVPDNKTDNNTLPSKYKKVFEDKGVLIFENTQHLPRIYLTKQAIKTSNKDALFKMLNKDFPIKEVSITDNFEFKNPSDKTLTSKLSYLQISNSKIQIKSETNLDAYLVILDSFYPGWKALIDGKETNIYRTNYNFRGLVLPEGRHNIELIYTPDSLKYGILISGVSLIMLMSSLLFSLSRD